MTAYETIIGLEVHAQILTQSKMFCGCSADYASTPPNTHVCPVCMALPGVLPVINRVAVEKTILAGLALHCAIGPEAVFARKNYHYADLPKGYQISQYELPLCHGGWIDIEVEAEAKVKRIGITRAHLEEDTGKLMHTGAASLVDLNRAGVPLLEIVTEPDLRSADEAHAYLTQLQRILRYLGVSTADMEKGAMRCEANVSVRPVGAAQFGTKVEVKNLNSFRAVKGSLDYEVARQIALLESGGRVVQVTMGWDDERGRTVVQRTKETANDYRYFPEPDLPPLVIEPAWAEEIRARLPELSDAKVTRFIREWGLEPKEARVLAEERPVAEYFEAVVAARPAGVEPKTVANWVTGELFRLLNAAGVGIEAVKITPARVRRAAGPGERGATQPQQRQKGFRCDVRDGPARAGDRARSGTGAGQRRGRAGRCRSSGIGAVSRRSRALSRRRGEAVRLADGSGDARDTWQGESGDAERSTDEGAQELRMIGRRCMIAFRHWSRITHYSSLVMELELHVP